VSKNDKKNVNSTPAETIVDAVPEIVDMPEEEVAQTGSEVTVVDGAPSTAMTPAALNAASAASYSVAQLEAGLAELEGRIHALGEKYPQWADALTDAMSRYGMAGGGDAFDVNVNAPMTYIRLRHGMSKNVPKELKVNVGEFFTDEKNLGESFDAMLVYAHETRKYFVGQELGAPECQSHDGKFGSRYGECAGCPFSQFDEKAKKAQCSRGYAVILATPDFSVIGEMSFLRTSAAAGRKFLQNLRKMSGGNSQWLTEVKTVEQTVGAHTNAVATGGLPKTRTTEEQREVLETLTKFFKLRAMTYAARGAQRRLARGALGGGSGGGALGSGGAAGNDESTPLL